MICPMIDGKPVDKLEIGEGPSRVCLNTKPSLSSADLRIVKGRSDAGD